MELTERVAYILEGGCGGQPLLLEGRRGKSQTETNAMVPAAASLSSAPHAPRSAPFLPASPAGRQWPG